jgi:hypothetical protein
MLWFKDQEGRLISANANLVQDWRHLAADASLEKIDLQSLPAHFMGHSVRGSYTTLGPDI